MLKIDGLMMSAERLRLSAPERFLKFVRLAIGITLYALSFEYFGNHWRCFGKSNGIYHVCYSTLRHLYAQIL